MTDNLAMPCPAVLLGATLALMTAYADTNPGSNPSSGPDTRRLMARKIVSNLLFLKTHPQLVGALRPVVARLHAQWVQLAGGLVGCGDRETQTREERFSAPVSIVLH